MESFKDEKEITKLIVMKTLLVGMLMEWRDWGNSYGSLIYDELEFERLMKKTIMILEEPEYNNHYAE